MPDGWVSGYHAVIEALRAGQRRVHRVQTSQKSPRIDEILSLARNHGVPTAETPDLGAIVGHDVHQGICAKVDPVPERPLKEALKERPQTIIALDQVQDPGNLGAICRSLVAFDLPWLLLPKDRCAPLGDATARAAVGALEHIRIIRETNLARALRQLRETHWIWGLDEGGETPLHETDFTESNVFVLGTEETGLRPLVAEQCHGLLRIPMGGAIPSLNVSNAAGILCYASVTGRGKKDP